MCSRFDSEYSRGYEEVASSSLVRRAIRIWRTNDLETDPVIDGGRGIGRRLCIFRDGLRGRVPGLLKRILAGDGLGVAIKELALGVNV